MEQTKNNKKKEQKTSTNTNVLSERLEAFLVNRVPDFTITEPSKNTENTKERLRNQAETIKNGQITLSIAPIKTLFTQAHGQYDGWTNERLIRVPSWSVYKHETSHQLFQQLTDHDLLWLTKTAAKHPFELLRGYFSIIAEGDIEKQYDANAPGDHFLAKQRAESKTVKNLCELHLKTPTLEKIIDIPMLLSELIASYNGDIFGNEVGRRAHDVINRLTKEEREEIAKMNIINIPFQKLLPGKGLKFAFER